MPAGLNHRDVSADILCDLTPTQREAATYSGGPLLIIAGPGSGKTEVISCRAAFLVRIGKVKPENLLAATFTEKAALSLKDRIQQKLPDVNVEAMQVSTIHSFCYRLLDEFRDDGPFPRGFRVLDDAGQRLFVYSRRRELGLGEMMKGRDCDFFGEVLRTYNLAAEELVNPARFEAWCAERLAACGDDEKSLWEERACIARSYARYLQLLEEAALTDFSNMQRHALEMLQRRPAVLDEMRGRFMEILIDEYQDTNAVQEDIIFLIAAPGFHLTVVGDDDQSIYRFRGATVKNILNFESKYGAAKVVKLEVNFRSVKPIIEHASALIRCNPCDARKEKELKCHRLHLTNDVALIHEYSAVQEAEAVVAAIKRLHDGGTVRRLNDVVILLRSVRSHGGPYLQALRDVGLPFRVIGDGQFFERTDIGELCNLFTFLGAMKPWGDRFLRCGVMGLGAGTEKALAAWKANLLEIADERDLKKIGVRSPADRAKLTAILDLKRRVQEGRHLSFLAILYEILQITDYFQNAEAAGDEEVIRNIGILTKVVADFDEHGGTRSPYPFMEYLQLLRQGALDSYHAEPDDAVSLMTVHQAKGLEFPVVVIGAAMAGRFPTRMRRSPYEIPCSLLRSGEPEVDDPHTVDERKLFYVAATRARDLLIVGTADVVNKRGGGPSPFIRELLGDRLEAAERRGRELAGRQRPEVEEVGLRPRGPRPRLSFYEMAYYYQCPVRYKYFVVDGMANILAGQHYFGSAVHRALELLHKDILAGKRAAEEDAATYVGRAWIPMQSGGRDSEAEAEERKMFEAAVIQVSRYVHDHRQSFDRVEMPEQPFAFKLEGTIVAGRIDLVRQCEDGKKEVVDFKTYSSKAVAREQAAKQMEIYALGLERSVGLGVGRHTLHFLEDGEVKSEDWDTSKTAAVEGHVMEIVGKIRRGEFRPRTDYCTACVEFKHVCPYAEGEERGTPGVGGTAERSGEGMQGKRTRGMGWRRDRTGALTKKIGGRP